MNDKETEICDHVLKEFFVSIENNYGEVYSALLNNLEKKFHLSSENLTEAYIFEKRVFSQLICRIEFNIPFEYKNDPKYITYIEQRIKKVISPLAKAFYSDILFSLTGQVYPNLFKAGKFYNDGLSILIEKENFMRARWIIARICAISKQINAGELIEKAFLLIKDHLPNIFQLEPLAIGKSIRESFMEASNFLSENSIETLIDFTEDFLSEQEKRVPTHLARVLPEYIRFLRKIKERNLVEHNQERYLSILVHLGDFYLSDEQQKAPLLASQYFKEALKSSSDYGYDQDKRNYILIQLRKAISRIHYHEFSSSVSINMMDFIRMFKNEAEEKYPDEKFPNLKLIAALHTTIPSLDDMIQELQEESIVIHKTVSVQVFNEIDPRGKFDPCSKELNRFYARNRLCYWTCLCEFLYSNVFRDLITTGLTIDNVISFINFRISLNSNENFFLKKGLTYYFDNQFIAAIHILLPQLEQIIRRLVTEEYPHLGLLQFKPNDVVIFQKLFDIVTTEESFQLFGPNFCEFIKSNLIDPNHRNIRNDVLHGFVGKTFFTEEVAFLILWIFLMLSEIIPQKE